MPTIPGWLLDLCPAGGGGLQPSAQAHLLINVNCYKVNRTKLIHMHLVATISLFVLLYVAYS